MVHRARREPDRAGGADRPRRLHAADPRQPPDRDRRRARRLALGDARRRRRVARVEPGGPWANRRSAPARDRGRSPRPRLGPLGGGGGIGGLARIAPGWPATIHCRRRHQVRGRSTPTSPPPGKNSGSPRDGPYVGQIDFASGTPHYSRLRVPTRGGTSLISRGSRRRHLVRLRRRDRLDRQRRRLRGGRLRHRRLQRTIKALAEGPDGKLYFAGGKSIGSSVRRRSSSRTRSAERQGRSSRFRSNAGVGPPGKRCEGPTNYFLRSTPPRGATSRSRRCPAAS